MRKSGLRLAESALLFAALLCTLPYVPSHELDRLPLLPAAAFAAVLFAGSRVMRWRPRYAMAAAETAGFAVFVWVANAVANLLYVP